MKRTDIVCVLFFLIIIASVSAENVTVTIPRNVSIVCNNASQCYALSDGMVPAFFQGENTNTTLQLSVQYTRELNTTVYVTNYTIEVTNYTIENCSMPAAIDNEGIKNALVTGVTAGLGTSLTETCRTACAEIGKNVAECELRASNALSSQVTAQTEAERYKTELNASQTICDVKMDSLTTSTNSLLRESENTKKPWMILGVLGSLVVLIVLGIVVWNMRPRKTTLGLDASKPMQEGGDQNGNV